MTGATTEVDLASTAPRGIYLPALDGIRFIAFVVVFLHHALPREGLYLPLLPLVVRKGYLGIDLFFCLSGFLIGLILELEQRTCGSAKPLRFYARRCLRIWPLYFFALFLGFVALPLATGSFDTPAHEVLVRWHAAWMIFFAGNWSAIQHGYPVSAMLQPLWSISVEEQFYLFIPFLFMLPRSKRIGVSILLCGVAIILRAHILADFPRAGLVSYLATPTRMDSFLCGSLMASLYLAMTTDQRFSKLMVLLSNPWSPAAILSLILAAAVLMDPSPRAGRIDDTTGFLYGYTVMALLFGALILAVSCCASWSRPLSWRPLVYLGKISFGLYVYHVWVIRNVAAHLTHGLHPGGAALSFLLTFCAAAISYRLLETPFLRYKRRFEVIPGRPL